MQQMAVTLPRTARQGNRARSAIVWRETRPGVLIAGGLDVEVRQREG